MYQYGKRLTQMIVADVFKPAHYDPCVTWLAPSDEVGPLMCGFYKNSTGGSFKTIPLSVL